MGSQAFDAVRVGRAGEHLVCADLLLRGLEVSVAAAGLGYDLIVDAAGQLSRVQVKATLGPPKNHGKTPLAYRFGLRRARGSRVRYDAASVDVFAFAFLDVRLVAYVAMADLITEAGATKQCIDWRSRATAYRNIDRWGNERSASVRFIEDYAGVPL